MGDQDDLGAVERRVARARERGVSVPAEVAALIRIARALEFERDRAVVALAASEEFRRAYQAGKQAMYALGGEACRLAMAHLPCGEGGIDREFRALIEAPRIKALEAMQAEARREMRVTRAARRWQQARAEYHALWPGRPDALIEAFSERVSKACCELDLAVRALGEEGE